MILDVGCGNQPHGDVNLDLYPHANIHRNIELNPKNIQNFIIGDARNLPFKSNTFSLVYCSHTLEHFNQPLKVLKELIRVSNKEIIIKIPHRFSYPKLRHIHKSFFNVSWFGRVLSKNPDVAYYDIETFSRFFKFFPFISLPYNITVRIGKRCQNRHGYQML